MKKVLTIVIATLVIIACVFTAGILITQKIQSEKPADLLARMKEGNARFVDGNLEHANLSAERRKETALHGQKPFAIVLACSDSRVPVETIFDAGVGDIFVVSNAGNVAQDAVVAGSIEYAVKHLNVSLLVILGHTECGAVQAGLSKTPAAGNIRAIQKIIAPVAKAMKQKYPSLKGTELLNATIKSNALKSESDILLRSEIIKDKVAKGSLKIVTAVYDLKTGTIEWDE